MKPKEIKTHSGKLYSGNGGHWYECSCETVGLSKEYEYQARQDLLAHYDLQAIKSARSDDAPKKVKDPLAIALKTFRKESRKTKKDLAERYEALEEKSVMESGMTEREKAIYQKNCRVYTAIENE